MSRSSNSLTTSDVITTPIKLKYTSSYDCGTIGAYGIQVLTGRNGPVTVTGSISEETLRYRSIRHLYYSNYLTGSYAVSASAADNFLQSTAASGTLDADRRYFPTESDAKITVISIPRGVFGQQISRKGFILSSSAYFIIDDGNGNLIDIANSSLPPYVNNLYYSPIITDWYVHEDEQNLYHVGNIIYPQGMVIITNPDYQEVFNPDGPTAYPDSDTFLTTESPKTLDILSNDNPGSGVLNPASVVLSGGDVALFTNNYDGTVTLNTSDVGTYTTYYTVESEIGGGCTLESNQASITVNVVAAVTTTTTTTAATTTTTTVPTINFTMAPGCSPAGSGRVTISNYTGAPGGSYEVSTITYSTQNGALNGTFTPDIAPKTYINVNNGTRWVAVRDATNPSLIKAKYVVVNCTPTTTVPPTTTTTTTPGTTTTTTTVPGTTTTTTTAPTTTTSTTTTTTTVQCVTFSSVAPTPPFPGSLSTTSQNIKINAAEGNTGQTSVAVGTLTIAPGCENTTLNFKLSLANDFNQTGSIICTINGNQGQGSISEVNVQRLGIGQSTRTRIIAQTGSYSVSLTGTFGAFGSGGDVSAVSFVEVYK